MGTQWLTKIEIGGSSVVYIFSRLPVFVYSYDFNDKEKKVKMPIFDHSHLQNEKRIWIKVTKMPKFLLVFTEILLNTKSI